MGRELQIGNTHPAEIHRECRVHGNLTTLRQADYGNPIALKSGICGKPSKAGDGIVCCLTIVE